MLHISSRQCELNVHTIQASLSLYFPNKNNPISTAGALICDVILVCYTVGLTQHLGLHYRKARFIVFDSSLALRTIDGDR